ncbi:MAG TPA: phosphodiester glycosidase family protein [Actinomycetota bacterium]|nr:phosphodiester glycosidase family protein [Actinomycetota bacterium]
MAVRPESRQETTREMYRPIRILAVVAVLGALAPAASAQSLPQGYSVQSRRQLAPGLEHLTLVRAQPAQVVNIARMSPGAEVTLRAVLSNETIGGPAPRLERTSSMCARVRCLAAVNADFTYPSGHPVGAVVSAGELTRSPGIPHGQLVVGPGGSLTAGPLAWKGTLMSSDLRQVSVEDLNAERGTDRLVLYTPSFGPSTATNAFGTELVVEVLRPAGAIRAGQTSAVKLLELRAAGDSTIPRNGAVLSGHGKGAAALADLWTRVQAGTAGREALLRVETDPPASESVGGSPILVREGRRFFGDVADNFVRGRHPRTIVGWTRGGDTLLLTVDGRQPGYSEGMSLAEAADLMIALGTADAINLDGGGSTTFVAGGAVANRPSDRLLRRAGRELLSHSPKAGDEVLGSVERPVVVALAIVAKTSGTVAPAPESPALGAAGSIDLPRVVTLAMTAPADPASDPAGGLPAVVPRPAAAGGAGAGTAARMPLMAAALLALAAAAAAVSAGGPVTGVLTIGTRRAG